VAHGRLANPLAIGDNTVMVRTRVFFGFLLIVALVGLVALDAWLTQQTVPDWSWVSGKVAGIFFDFLLLGALLTGVVALVVSWGVLETGRLCRAAGYQPAVGWACFATFVMVVLPWVNITPALGDRSSIAQWEVTCLWLAISVTVGMLWILFRGEPDRAIPNVSMTIWLIVYLGFFGSFVTRLRMDMAGPLGAWLVLYFLIVVKFADIGAYFTGIAIGRHRIVPKISPGKTLEGYLGGMVLAVIVAVSLSWLGGIIMPIQGASPGPWLSVRQAAIFGVTMGLAGQLGDLVVSLVKRDAAIKDSGSLIPAFGGVMDVIDAPLFAAPLAWWLLTGWLA
jgi:phosphatidate cytidylyltransferase